MAQLCNLTIQYLESRNLDRLTGICPVAGCGLPVARHRDENAPINQPGATGGSGSGVYKWLGIRLVRVTHINTPNVFDESSAIYEVTNMNLPRLRGTDVDDIRLYMRQEAKDLWKRLEQSPNHAIIFINGCPGVGKSVVVFAQTFAQCRAKGKSLLYLHVDQSYQGCFVMDRQGSVAIVETKDKLNFVLDERENYDVTLVDGRFQGHYLEQVFLEFPVNKKLIFCTSYQAIDLRDEAYFNVSKRLIKHTVCSWTLEDYRLAAEVGCLSCVKHVATIAERDEVINSHYYLCGGSIRLFNKDQGESKDRLNDSLDSVNNYMDLFRNHVGPSSTSAVNRLMALHRSTGKIPVMSVPLSRYVFDALAERCADETEDMVVFIKDARKALPNNPSWQGWVTELEVISILKIYGRLELFTNANGTKQLTLSQSVIKELKQGEESPKYADCEAHTWILPYKWNQPWWDAVHIVGNKVVDIVQITSGKKHTHKFNHLAELLAQLQPQPNNKKIRVHFLTVCRQTNYASVEETNIGQENLPSNIDITQIKVWYRELRQMTIQYANEPSMSGKKRKRS